VIVPWLRAEVAGYFLGQITDSRANGVAVPGSLEQVAGQGYLRALARSGSCGSAASETP
jgi:hypothetical protein